jgi:hypothetical protein
MRHPRLFAILRWLGSAFGGFVLLVISIAALGDGYPVVAALTESIFNACWPIVTDTSFLFGATLLFAILLAILIYSGTGELAIVPGLTKPANNLPDSGQVRGATGGTTGILYGPTSKGGVDFAMEFHNFGDEDIAIEDHGSENMHVSARISKNRKEPRQ